MLGVRFLRRKLAVPARAELSKASEKEATIGELPRA
jgi:hypothetical protein